MYNRNQKTLHDHRILSGKYIRLPPDLKEKFRHQFDTIRDEYENANLGNFEKLFPLDLQEDTAG